MKKIKNIESIPEITESLLFGCQRENEMLKEIISNSMSQQIDSARIVGLINGVIEAYEQLGTDIAVEGVVDVLIEIRHIVSQSPQPIQGQDWISVGNQPEDKWVLLYNGNWIGVGKFNNKEDKERDEPEWQDETSEYISPDPTHWMPLPKPPSQ